ncbi:MULTISPECIES: ubiquinol-cytochrome C chaperone family protein [Nitratireductor]|uniref:ubiquinol-cytochrome C chaperone family protein n=1 Tax=Nitratireductor TaxID=245876 RepID=UPI000D0CAF86|nr:MULTISPECIES: ubiquinol-cytochrome C chaperone family protein [Nitratireductor]PSM17037.1 ubiquinol-cytochrome C chaperone [Nitratireductor sp. StC3]
MLKQLLGLAPKPNQAVVEKLYRQIVAAARQPVPYESWSVPDTPLGRFEMLSLHVFLLMHRARPDGAPLSELVQDLTDEFFRDVDHSLRELGIGDLGIAKRVKKLARMFYGRAGAYGEAIESGDRSALAAALARNIRPDIAEWQGAAPLADYVMAAHLALAGQDSESLLRGEIAFPTAAERKTEA